MSESQRSEGISLAETATEAIAPSTGNNESKNMGTKSEVDRNEILSRRKQKKLLKLAKWEEAKKLKRQKEKEKYKEKRKIEAALGIPGKGRQRKILKANKMDNSTNPVHVAIDFDYDNLMSDKDIAKCAKQLQRVYTLNRKSKMPIHLYYTSINAESRVEKALSRNIGYQNWDVKICPESYSDLFTDDRIVYLSSESENVLHELDPNAVYIIGGLVDHNHHKGLSLERAEKKALRTARLPLSEHISMKTRTVLTIVHVFEILLKISEGNPWKETLLEVLPQRKFHPKGISNKSNETGNNNPENAMESSEDEENTEATVKENETNVVDSNNDSIANNDKN